MKIRSLLLGSVALAGLSTAGYAADLGVATALDVCDSLGLSGLTISSDDNCLQITGNVAFEYDYGNYKDDTYGTLSSGAYTVTGKNGTETSAGDLDTWLQFVGTSSTDFGPASITLKLLAEDLTGEGTFAIDKAWVGIGDTTVIMAGYKSSVFADGDDKPLDILGGFNSGIVDAGVGSKSAGAATGGEVIQVTSALGNGVKLSGGLENLGAGAGKVTGVAVVSYSVDSITGHVSFASDTAKKWKMHAGFTGAWDPVTVVGAYSTDETQYWNALGSIAAKFDMFTLAATVEGATDGEGISGSVSAKVTDGVTLNLSGRYWNSNGKSGSDGADLNQVEAGLSAAITDTLTMTGAIGAIDSTKTGKDQILYAKTGLAWAPGGGFTSSVEGTFQNNGAYKAVFKAAKSLK